MATMNISLNDELRAYVDQQVESRSYSSSSEYIRDLIRQDRDCEKLRRLLLEGAESPIEGDLDSAWFEAERERIRKLAAE